MKNCIEPKPLAVNERILVNLFAAVSVVPICAQEVQATSDNETRALFTECAPIYLLVEEPNEPAKRIGLEKRTIQNSVESRLRSARLYEDEFTNQYLYVQILVLRNEAGVNVFSIQVSLERYVEDVGYGFPAFVAVWDAGTVGTGSDSQFILGSLSIELDEFVAKYLRVNDKYCDEVRQTDAVPATKQKKKGTASQ